jgi:hypothetical protein
MRLKGYPAGRCQFRLPELAQVSGQIVWLGAVDEFEELVVGHDIAVARLDITQGLPTCAQSLSRKKHQFE